MGNDTRDAVGVDISKAHLDVHRLHRGGGQFGNDAAGFEALAAWIGASADEVVYESTGPWHRARRSLVERLPLTPLRARRFARRWARRPRPTRRTRCLAAAAGGAAVTSTNCTRRGTGW